MRYLLVIALLCIAPVCRADSISTVAADLTLDSPVPFQSGIADDLAANLLDAQALAPYASEESLDLSIDAVIRAISIDGGTYVGLANVDPITWLQSDIAIDPSASIGITPTALDFGAQTVTTPEPEVWVFLLAGLLAIGGIAGWLWLRGPMQRTPEPPGPIILTEWGPVTEWARSQAAANMLADPDLRGRVHALVLNECGGNEAAGTAEFYRRYPELRDAVSQMQEPI